MKYIILLLVAVFLGVVAQLCLKKGMMNAGIVSFTANVLDSFKKMFLNVFVVLGFLFYGVSNLFWIVILNKLELSYAYPIVSLSYFFVALLSMVFFGEQVSFRRWVSIFIIILGVVVVGLS
jgi:drug/metabolite transporter (DMT)-like permease